jgi:hypothetical protein
MSYRRILAAGLCLCLLIGCVSLHPVEPPPPDPKPMDPKKDEKNEFVPGPILKRLLDLKAKREEQKEARMREWLESREVERKDKDKGKESAKANEKMPSVPVVPKPDTGKAAQEPTKADPATSLKQFETCLKEATDAYSQVKDYTCVFVKQIVIKDKLMEEQASEMAFREKPFSVHFKFVSPANVRGQEACYVAGAHDGKCRVKGAGIKGIVGWLTLPIDDSRIMAENRHTIEDAGIGKLILEIANAAKLNVKNTVSLTEETWDGHACYRFEVNLAEKHPKVPFRTVVHFDKERKLPIRIENYDPPRKAGDPPVFTERYAYTQLKLNVGLPADAFDK